MKENILFFMAFTLTLSSCDQSDPELNYEVLKKRFNGKYEIISASSEVAIDLNMDGKASINLFEENEEILESEIVLNIYEDANIFTERWPIEYIGVKPGQLDSTIYNPSYSVTYAEYALSNYFQFDENQNKIELIDPTPILYYGVVDTIIIDARFVFPDSIVIEEDETLTVTSRRKLYTFYGYMTVQVTASYKRYTKVT